jgi:hypothetical protein
MPVLRFALPVQSGTNQVECIRAIAVAVEFGFEAHARDTGMALAIPTSQVVGCERCFNFVGLLTKGLKVRDTFVEPNVFTPKRLSLLVDCFPGKVSDLAR